MAEPTPSTSSQKVESLTFINKNGGTVLLRAGHQYYARRKHKSGLTVWACTQRKTCKGLLRIMDQNIIEETHHACTPDFTKNVIEESFHKLRQSITQPEFKNVPQSYNNLLGQIKNTGIDLISEIPSFPSVKSTLYRYRNTKAGVSKIQHADALGVEIPASYEDFLLADYCCNANNTRIIVFASAEARENMCRLTHFYGVGTFKSCPSPFAQLYTIHADTGSTIQETKIMPFIYAIMSNRKTESYIILFQMVKSQLPNWNPVEFKVDYEQAAMKAIAEVFPSATLKGCYYHYNKAIFKKGKQLNLNKSSDLKEVRIVQLSAVLPLLPENDIINGWVYIIARYGDPETEGKKKFIKYMEKHWLRQEFMKVWCVFGAAHRTTNALEGWHTKLNRTEGAVNPNIMRFLQIIKNDSDQYAVRNISKKSLKNKRSKKTILKDEFVQEVQLELTLGHITIGHALEVLRN